MMIELCNRERKKEDDYEEKGSTLWVSGPRQYTKNSYTDLTPDLRQK